MIMMMILMMMTMLRAAVHLRRTSLLVWTVVVEEVLHTVGLVEQVCIAYGARVPRRFGGFV